MVQNVYNKRAKISCEENIDLRAIPGGGGGGTIPGGAIPGAKNLERK